MNYARKKRENFVFTLIFNFYLHFINIITLLYIISWAQNDTPRAPWWPSLLMDCHTHHTTTPARITPTPAETHPGRPGGLLCSWIATPTPGHPPHHHTRQDHTDTNRDTPRAPVLLINHTKTPAPGTDPHPTEHRRGPGGPPEGAGSIFARPPGGWGGRTATTVAASRR